MTAATKNLSLPVQGMTCASCVAHVEGALKELPGVSDVLVNLATSKANLAYDPAQVTLADMARAVDDVGYAVPVAELTLQVFGMTCASCVAHVEGALGTRRRDRRCGQPRPRRGPGHLPARHCHHRADEGRRAREVGYQAQERSEGANALDRDRPAREEEIKRQGRNLLIARTIGLVVMAGTYYGMLGPFKAVVPVWLSYKWLIRARRNDKEWRRLRWAS